MQLASYTLIITTRCEGKGKREKLSLSATTGVASATTGVPKGKKMKVLTHRPQYIEPTVVPEFGEEASSTAEARQAAPTAQSVEEPTVVPKVPTVGPAQAKNDKAEEPQVEKIEKNTRNSESSS
jgi:hypothetical protein